MGRCSADRVTDQPLAGFLSQSKSETPFSFKLFVIIFPAHKLVLTVNEEMATNFICTKIFLACSSMDTTTVIILKLKKDISGLF